MAWALQFDGVNDYIPTTEWFPDNTNWSIEVDLFTGSDITSSKTICGKEVDSSIRSMKLFISGGKFGALHKNDWTAGGTINTPAITANTRYTVKVQYVGGVFSIWLDGVQGDTLVVNGDLGGRPVLAYIGSGGGNKYVGMQLITLDCKDLTTPANDRLYDATASSHAPGAQPVLVDTISSQDATGVNFPTDGSAWVDLGFEGPAALQLDGVNDYCNLATDAYMHQRLDAGDWAYSIDAIIPSTTADIIFLGKTSNSAGYLVIKNNQVKFRYNTSSGSDVTIATTHVFDGSRITLDIYREAGGVHKVAIDGVVVGSTTSANVGDGAAYTNLIGKRGETLNPVAFQLISLQFKNGIAGSVVYDWDATASSHALGAQLILTETVTANNATGVDFPTDGSAWVPLAGGASTLVADSGGYTYTGTAATLTVPVSSTLAADTGGYSYTGANAALFKGSVLNTDTANYTYSGTNVTLTYTPAGTNLLAPDTGNYSYSGGDITFSRNRVIITSSGNYTYSGSGVSIILPGQIWTDRPTAVTTYTNNPTPTTNWTDK